MELDAPTRPDALFIRMASRPIPRVLRMMSVAREKGLNPAFCGAHREEGLPSVDSWNGFPVVRIGPHCPLLNGRRPLAYLKLVAGFNQAAYRLLTELAPRLIHVSDIETVPAAALYARRHRVPLLYNIHDNLAQRYRVPAVLRYILNWIEGAAVLLSDRTIVPEPYRREALPSWSRAGIHIVRNTPRDPGSTRPSAGDSGKMTLFYGGWIDWGRGFDTLFALMEIDPDLQLRVAGEGGRDLVRRLEEHPRVEYLGFVDHERVLRETAACHFVPALYHPARLINRFAASNKLAEAFAVGRPVIANSELEIVRQLGDQSCLVTAPYGDVEDLAREIRRLWDAPAEYAAACRAARAIYERDYAWTAAEADARHVFEAVMGKEDAGSPAEDVP